MDGWMNSERVVVGWDRMGWKWEWVAGSTTRNAGGARSHCSAVRTYMLPSHTCRPGGFAIDRITTIGPLLCAGVLRGLSSGRRMRLS